MLGQRIAAESLHRARFGELQDSQHIAYQVGPAELRLAGVIFQVRAETIAAQDATEHLPQQVAQNLAAASGGHRIDHVARGHKGPQVALIASGPPARLVHVQHRLILQLLFQFLARGRYRLAGFFPALLCASQTDVHSQNLSQ